MKLKNVLKIGVVPVFAMSLIGCNSNKTVQVTFKNYDGTVLQSEKINTGEDAAYKQEAIPSKPASAGTYGNKFIGWNKPLTNIKKDTVLIAQYKAIDDTYVDNDHDGMPADIDPDDTNPESTYGAKSMVYFENQKIKIDFSKFLVDKDKIEYDNDIAKLGLLMSNPKADFNDGKFSEKAYGGRVNALYSRLGCDYFKHFDFKDEAAKTYKYDPNDTTSGVYGHKYIIDENGQARDLIFIAFEGTNGPRRWASNFDVGYDDGGEEGSYCKDYYEKAKRTDKGEEETGTRADHPEWDDKNYHKGFYVAAMRVLKDEVDGDQKKEGPVKFLNYIEQYITGATKKPIVFVTGHSRGGAMANIVGTYLETKATFKDNIIPITYTFASPEPFGASSKITTQHVYNVINSDDIVTKVPFSEWGFSRLGEDVIYESIRDVPEYEEEYNNNRTKRKYKRIENADSIFHNVNCHGRDEIYNLNLPEAPEEHKGEPAWDPNRYLSKIALNETSFVKKEDAEEEISGLEEYYQEKFGDFFNYFELKPVSRENIFGDTVWDIYANNCIGTLTALAQAVMIKNEKVLNNVMDLIPLISNGKFLELAASIGINILQDGGDAIALPHDYGSYQIILNNYKKPQP